MTEGFYDNFPTDILRDMIPCSLIAISLVIFTTNSIIKNPMTYDLNYEYIPALEIFFMVFIMVLFATGHYFIRAHFIISKLEKLKKLKGEEDG